MRVVDKIVLVVFAIAMVVLLFLQQCSYDIWVFVLAAVVGAVSVFAMIKQSKEKEPKKNISAN